MRIDILLQNGDMIDLINPDPNAIKIDHIATSLSNICRFGGRIDSYYSVAEHCVHMANLACAINPLTGIMSLLHDASEAYMGDVVQPLKQVINFKYKTKLNTFDRCLVYMAKRRLYTYEKIEKNLLDVIYNKYLSSSACNTLRLDKEFSDKVHTHIKSFDEYMFSIERSYFFNDLEKKVDMSKLHPEGCGWSAEKAQKIFKETYYDDKFNNVRKAAADISRVV